MAEWKPRKTWEQYLEEDKKGLEQPFFDPIDILAGVGGAARSIGSKALAGLLPDVVGGIAADTVADRGNSWAPLAANVGASLLAGRMLDPANLAEIRRIAPKALANERGAIDPRMFGLPTNKDGTVTLYHGTTKQGANSILDTGEMIGPQERRVYFTTDPNAGYGDGTVIAVDVDPQKLNLDDEFPDGRYDFAVEGSKIKVKNPRKYVKP